MTPHAQAREIVEHYRLQGWTGRDLKVRLLRHASILWGHDREVARSLFRSADMR